MKNYLIIPIHFVGKIGCLLSGHQFITTRNITAHFKEYRCLHCGLELTNNALGEKINLTQEHRDINETLNQLYKKRHPIA